MHANTDKLDGFSRIIIGRALFVSNTLRVGFAEKIYENALAKELRKVGLSVTQQHAISVHYAGDVIVETVSTLIPAHKAQCLNYLRATNLALCQPLNFGNRTLEIKRIVNNF
jgi:hypothetical protein